MQKNNFLIKKLSKKRLLALVVGFLLIILIIFFGFKGVGTKKSNKLASSHLDACIVNKQTHAGGFFNPGDLMVTFGADVEIMEAQNLLAQHGLLAEEDFLLNWPWEYVAPGLLLINVPAGEEFKWWCILEQEPQIINVQLNQVSKITGE